MPDPKEPINETEKKIWGADARRHVITGHIIEVGSGALSERGQAYLHLNTILHELGEEAMLDMRRRLDEHYS